MKKNLLFGLLLIFFSPLFSQVFEDYQPVRASGPIPEAFRTLSSEKYQAALDTMSRQGKRYERKARERFYLESHFLIDELLMSGKVLFNDPITKYVNKVAQNVLQSEEGLYDQLQIYVVNSTAVNAFTTNNGTIFINMGLLAKLETEAQLAFIICHEAVHYTHEHVIKSYVHEKKIDKDPGLFRERPSLDERLMAKSNYSVKNELEADNEGLDIFLQSDYNSEAAIDAFEQLQTGYLPFPPKRSFNIADFTSDYFSYHDSLTIDSLYIAVDEDEEEEAADEDAKDYDTHPNMDERIEKGKELIEGRTNAGSQDFIEGADQFEKTRDMARFELCRQFLLSRDYERSLYCAHNLLEQFPGNFYLQTIVMRSIYGAARLHESHEYDDLVRGVHRNPFEIQPYSYFLANMPPLGGSVLTTELVAPLLKRKEKDHAKQLILEQMIETHLDAVEEEEAYGLGDTSYSIDTIVTKLRAEFGRYDSVYTVRKAEREKRKGRKSTSSLRNTLVLDPVVYKVDLRNDNPVSYLDSEESLLNFIDYIEHCANAADINIQFVKTTDIEQDEIDEFNDVRFLKQVREDKFKNEAAIVSVDHNRCYALSKKYNCSSLAFIGSIELTDRKEDAEKMLLITTIYLPLLPYGIAYALTPKREYMNFVVVFDLETDEVRKSTYHLKKSNDSAANVKSSLYYNFIKLKQ